MKDYRFKNSESLYKSREMKIKKPQAPKPAANQNDRSRTISVSEKLLRSEEIHLFDDQSFVVNLMKSMSTFYLGVEQRFKQIDLAMTKLQAKIAECFGSFNKIEWKLTKEVHEMSESKMLNNELVIMNKEIEDQLQRVKNDYDDLKKRKYISNLQKKIDELKEFVHKVEIQQYKNKFNKHQNIIFEDNIDRLEQVLNKSTQKKEFGVQRDIYNSIIKNLIVLLKGKGDVVKWMSEKMQQNITMKFKLIKYQGVAQNQ